MNLKKNQGFALIFDQMIRDAHFANESPGMAEHTLTSENSPIQAERSTQEPIDWRYRFHICWAYTY